MGEAVQAAGRGRVILWEPQRGPQTALLSCPVQEIFFGGARGGGKTDGMLGVWLRHQHEYGASARGIWVRRTMPELEEVVSRMQEVFPQTGATWMAGRRVWRMPNGAELKMRFLEDTADARKYQGHSYSILFVDEAGNWPTSEAIDMMAGTVRSAAGVACQTILTGNPGGPGHEWLKKRFIDPSPPMTPFSDQRTGVLRVFIPSRLQDNRILCESDPGYADRLKGAGAPWLVKAWLDGDWNASPSGGIVRVEWFKRYREPPANPRRIIQSWDTASKAKEMNCYSACGTWAETETGYYLLHVLRERLEYPALKRMAVSLYQRYKPHAVVIEDKGSGQSLIQDLRATSILPVVPWEPSGDKVIRMSAQTALIESGRVFLPDAASWLPDYEVELGVFPAGAWTDQVDMTSQALEYLRGTAIELAVRGVPRESNDMLRGYD
jgi:predicted phage terminase large subunit-like protein